MWCSVLRVGYCWVFSELLREGNRLYSYHLSRVLSHPPNYTTYYLTLTEPKSRAPRVHLFGSTTPSSFSALANKINNACHNALFSFAASICFDWTACLPIWRWQSASGWLSCLLGKDSRLYSYLKKRLENPTTIQSTTSAPRTASMLLQQHRSSKVKLLQWHKEKETEKVILIN